jgi:hypothetical protein
MSTSSSSLVRLLSFGAKLAVALAAPPLAFGYALSALSISHAIHDAPGRAGAIVAGACGFAVAWALARRRASARQSLDFLQTLEHELTHALAAALCLRPPRSLRASAHEGGELSFDGAENTFVLLAPYVVPTATLVALVLPAVLRPELAPAADAVVGAAYAYDLVSTLAEVSPRQTDLRRAGFLFSLLVVPAANAFVAFGVLAYASGGYPALLSYVTSGPTYALRMLGSLVSF